MCLLISFICGLEARRIAEHRINSSWWWEDKLPDIPRSELPPCPCTIFMGFCSKRNVLHGGAQHDASYDEWGTACVADEEAIITMPWMVQCVPTKKASRTYPCPKHLNVKCDPERVEDPCDTSALGSCDVSACGAGYRLKKQLPRFCHLHECTPAECCDDCSEAEMRDGVCKNSDGSQVPDSCCMDEEEEDESGEFDCAHELKLIAGPTTLRLGAYGGICGFNSADVDVKEPVFTLTGRGRRKLCEEACQNAPALVAGVPDGVWQAAQDLQKKCPDDVALKSQVNPVGLFAAANELDKSWKNCGEAGEVDDDDAFVDKAVFDD